MIVYFSATGNSKYVAERIAEEFGDTAVSIEGSGGRIELESQPGKGTTMRVHFPDGNA